MKQRIANHVYVAILAGLLAGGLAYPPLHTVAAVMAWFTILCGSVGVVGGFIIAYLADNSESIAERKKCREILRNVVEKSDKRSKLSRRLGLAKVSIIVILLAVSGMTFACVSYAVLAVLVRLLMKLHRAVLETELN